MTCVLIVDDSPVDRELASGLLKAQSALEIRQAADGKLALDLMGQETPDIVVDIFQHSCIDRHFLGGFAALLGGE